MTVRCKVYVSGIRTSKSWSKEPGKTILYELTINFVSGSECPENKMFWEASPSGQLVFSTINAEAVKELELGKEFYMDLIPA